VSGDGDWGDTLGYPSQAKETKMDARSVAEAHRQIVASADRVEVTGLLILLRQRAADFGWKDVVRHLGEAGYAAGRSLGRECRNV
jgi:hypothetical protein